MMYSIDWDTNEREPTFWNSGASGWYYITPAPEYRAMHDLVSEGITLYHTVLEIYEEARDRAGKGKRSKALMMPIDQLLKQVSTVSLVYPLNPNLT